MASGNDPRLIKQTALSKATQLESRLNALVGTSATDISPNIVYLPGGVQQAVFTGAGTAGGTWTCPDAVNSVQVECWGAGGGGDGGDGASGGQGGGGGEYAAEDNYAVIPGNIYTFAVGTAGQGGVCGGNSGTSGGDTVFDLTGPGVAGHGGSPGGQGSAFNGGTGSASTRHSDGGAGGISQPGIGTDNPSSVPNLAVWWPCDDLSSTGGAVGPITRVRDASGHSLTGRAILVDNDNGGLSAVSAFPAPLQAPTKTTAGVSTHGSSVQIAQHVPDAGVAIQAPNPLSPIVGPALTVSAWVQGSQTLGTWSYGNRFGLSFATIAANCDYVNGVVNGFASSTTAGFALFLRNRVPGFYLSNTGTGSRAIFAPSALPVPDGTWHQVAGTWDGTTMKLFVDGAQVASAVPGFTTFSSGSAFVTCGVNPYTETDSFFTGSLSNFWLATSAVSPAFVAQAFGSGSVLGGSGGGASGGSAGAGLPGASSVSSAGTAGGASAPGADSAHGGSGAGGAGGNQGSSGVSAANVAPFGGGGGGAGQTTSPSAVTRATFAALHSASYCGIDAQGGNNGVLYDISDVPQAGVTSPYPAVSQISEKMYAGGNPGSSFNGSMNSVAVFPNLAPLLAGRAVNTVTVTLTVQSTGASVLPVAIAQCGFAPPSLGSDADVSSFLAGYTPVCKVAVPAGPAGRQVTVDITTAAISTAILSSGPLCLVLGGLQGSASHDIGDGAWNSAEAYAWNTVVTGANSDDPATDLSITVEYYSGANTVAGDGAPGQLILTFVDNRSYPVAAVHPAATTDANGNAFAAGITSDSVVGFDPTITTPGQRVPATWKPLGTLSGSSGITVDIARYRYAPDDGGTLVVQFAGHTATTGGGYTGGGTYTFANALLPAYRPVISSNPSFDRAQVNVSASNPSLAVGVSLWVTGKNNTPPGQVSIQIPGTATTPFNGTFHATLRIPLT